MVGAGEGVQHGGVGQVRVRWPAKKCERSACWHCLPAVHTDSLRELKDESTAALPSSRGRRSATSTPHGLRPSWHATGSASRWAATE